jgi:hypothetical protein
MLAALSLPFRTVQPQAGKVRHLLKDGKAKVAKLEPFAIQLLFESTEYT